MATCNVHQLAAFLMKRFPLPVARFATGGVDFTEAIELIKRNTRRYSKRQITWFSSIEGVNWLDMGKIGEEAAAGLIVTRWRERRFGVE